MSNQRISTGVPGLDEILDGGLIPHRSYLIVGGPGSGKSILSLQWLVQGQKQGQAGLYISLAELGSEIKKNMAVFGWNLKQIKLLDLTPLSKLSVVNGEYQVFPPSEVEQTPIWQAIYQAIEESRPQRVVIDPMTQLLSLSTNEYQFRKQILGLLVYLNEKQCTSFLTFEPSQLEREASLALAVDGVIRLRNEISPGRVIGLRSVQVEKMRGTDFMSGLHPLRITPQGIKIFPHRIERPGAIQPGKEKLTSGIPPLDELLGGGLESGTTTIISGHSGVGKSILGMQFLVNAVARGKRAILYTFEESIESIVIRCRGIGIPIDQLMKKDTLKLVRLNPMELYPDEFLALIRNTVEQESREIVMIDSLRGYQLAMEQFGTLVANIQNMVTCLNNRGLTTLLINEIEQVTGALTITEIGGSFIADTILFLRYAEYAGKVIRVISCFKKRLGRYQPELREFHITSSGIQVGEALEHLQGLLTGVPEVRLHN